MSRLRDRLPIAAVVALALLVLAGSSLAGFGPDLPGPPLREWLGLTEDRPERTYVTCEDRTKADLGTVRSPRTPPAPPGSWRAEPAAPFPRDELRAAQLGRLVYLANGHDAKTRSVRLVETFDPRTRRYGRAPDTPRPVDHSVLASHQGKLYLVGGWDLGQATKRLFTYDPRTRVWRELPPMRIGRASPAGEVVGGKLYVAGGLNADSSKEVEATPERSVEAYDFATGRWSDAPPMRFARHHTAAAELDGKLYVVGGRLPGEFSMTAAERFDPRTGRWETIAPLPAGSGGLELAAAGGKIVATGGGDDLEKWVTPASWAYDPRTNRWERLPDLRLARHGHAMLAVGSRVYVFGGSPCTGFGRTAQAESLPVPS